MVILQGVGAAGTVAGPDAAQGGRQMGGGLRSSGTRARRCALLASRCPAAGLIPAAAGNQVWKKPDASGMIQGGEHGAPMPLPFRTEPAYAMRPGAGETPISECHPFQAVDLITECPSRGCGQQGEEY